MLPATDEKKSKRRRLRGALAFLPGERRFTCPA
jgi:hypothetical protein